MDDSSRFYEKPNFWPRLFRTIFAVILLIVFWHEVITLLKLFFYVIKLAFTIIVSLVRGGLATMPQPGTPPEGATTAAIILALAGLLYLGFYFLILRWVGLFVLPAKNKADRKQVYERLTDYVLGLHGPAVFVKHGEIIARKEEKEPPEKDKDWYPSLALVDMTSAIAIESRELHGIAKVLKKPPSPTESATPLRALGPGIGFLGVGERILGCVDLRKQIRRLENVRGFTSDGIELTANVNLVFTLGDEADVMIVIDSREANPEHAHLGLRRVEIDRESMKIKSISDNIDNDDKEEIYNAIKSGQLARTDNLAMGKKKESKAPYTVDQNRVIRAVITSPRNSSDGKLEGWTDLPARVAASVLLDDLSKITYDELYSLDSPEETCRLYDQFKPEFDQKVKNLGVLSYQFIQRKDGAMPRAGEPFKRNEYIIWEARDLEGNKPLRERGIKVIKATFSDFKPTDKTIPDQRFDNWRSKWQKKTEITNAEYDYEIKRKMNHARAAAQREIVYNLSQIFKLPGYNQDAMAIRIFQALESAASNPATNKLLPRDTLEMMKNFQRLFLPGGRDGQQADQPYGAGDDYRPPDG